MLSSIDLLYFLAVIKRMPILNYSVPVGLNLRAETNIFWWYYRSPQRASSVDKTWPTILWLQGGPVCLLSEI